MTKHIWTFQGPKSHNHLLKHYNPSSIFHQALTRDSETRLLALRVTLEVIGIAQAAAVGEDLAPLGDGVVIEALQVRPAGAVVHLEKACLCFNGKQHAVTGSWSKNTTGII